MKITGFKKKTTFFAYPKSVVGLPPKGPRLPARQPRPSVGIAARAKAETGLSPTPRPSAPTGSGQGFGERKN